MSIVPGEPVRTDLCAGNHKGAETSAAAYSTTPKERRESQRARILWLVKFRPGGVTCEEAEKTLGIPHQTCSARIAELATEGAIKHGEIFRPTSSGKKARVYFAV